MKKLNDKNQIPDSICAEGVELHTKGRCAAIADETIQRVLAQ